MKRILFLLPALLLTQATMTLAKAEYTDTVFVFNAKTYEIRDSIDQIKIRVTGKSGDDYKTVFEGIYSDEKSYERWSVVEEMGFQIPFVTHKKKKEKRTYSMQSHIGGFGWGRAAFTDGIGYTDIDGVPVDLNRSYEFNYNLIEHITPLFFNIVGLSSGLGFSWRNYYLDNGYYLDKVDDLVNLVDNTAAHNQYKYSCLRNWYLTLPVMLELQMFKHTRLKPYLAAGIIGDIRLTSMYKSKYVDTNGVTHKTKETGLNSLPLSVDYVVQAGLGKVSIYGKYSPMGIFESGKGPDVQHASIGFLIGM